MPMNDGTFFLIPLESPKPTPLYGLSPRGEGTGDVESLFSYFLRLGYEHRLTPKKLIEVVLPDVAAQIPQLSGWKFGWAWDKKAGKDTIAAGSVASRWARLLSAATGRPGLETSTMFPLLERIWGDLVTTEERVCLQCLASDCAAGELPYGRLLWRMRSVHCCPIHRCHLISPMCGRPVRTTASQFLRVKLTGVCNQCGSIGHRCMNVIHKPASPVDIWRAEQCRRMIAAFPLIAAADPRDAPLRIKEHCVEPGSQTSLALRSGTLESSLSRWLNVPGARLSFDNLLDICGIEGFDLASLLQGRLEKCDVPGAPNTPQRAKRRMAQVDHAAVRRELTDALMTGTSITQVAARLRVDISTLLLHRDLYDQVRQATRERKAAAINSRQDEAIARAEAAAIKLIGSNRRLSQRNAASVGSRLYPSEATATVLALMRIGLGDRSARYPAPAARMGEAFLGKIDLAVQRVKAATGQAQCRLDLGYR